MKLFTRMIFVAMVLFLGYSRYVAADAGDWEEANFCSISYYHLGGYVSECNAYTQSGACYEKWHASGNPLCQGHNIGEDPDAAPPNCWWNMLQNRTYSDEFACYSGGDGR